MVGWRQEYRVQVQRIHAQGLQVWQLVDDTLKIAPEKLVDALGIGAWLAAPVGSNGYLGSAVDRVHALRVVRRVAVVEAIGKYLVNDHVFGPRRHLEIRIVDGQRKWSGGNLLRCLPWPAL